MKTKYYLLLYIISLGILTSIGHFQKNPGYMDAEYYYAGGIRLYQGHGFSEMLLWNYLDDPQGLPHPSHGYWMPLASIIAAGGMVIKQSEELGSARLVLIILAAIIPPLTARLAFSISHDTSKSVLAGLLALFPGLYTSYLSTTDTFGLAMLGGGLFFLTLLMGSEEDLSIQKYLFRSLLLGLIAGMIHLMRVDGILWLFLACGALAFSTLSAKENSSRAKLLGIGCCLIGYALLAGPWILRNLNVFGTPFPSGGASGLWLLNYDELVIYPASRLSFERWWQAGLGAILEARWWALGLNLQTVIAVQGAIFLLPLAIIGGWQKRHSVLIRVASLGWALTFLVMTIVFPFQGARGGFFHSSAIFQPLVWAITPIGLEKAIGWLGRLRHWDIKSAQKYLSGGLVCLALLVSLLAVKNRVIGEDIDNPAWNLTANKYVRIEEFLISNGIEMKSVVMVNNPPGYFAANRHAAVSIPYGDFSVVIEVAKRYQAGYLILEFAQIPGSEHLYTQPASMPGLRYLGSVEGARIYEFTEGY